MSGPASGTPYVAAPVHGPPTVGLLVSAIDVLASAPRTTAESAGGDTVVSRWLNGVTYAPEACSADNGGTRAIGCAPFAGHDAATLDVDPSNNPAIVSTSPFWVWAGDTCSTFGWEIRDYNGRARRTLEQWEQYLVEAEFFSGTAAQAGTVAGADYPTDQWLANTNATVVGTGLLKPYQALGELSDYLASCAGGSQGMIHVKSGLIHALVRNGVVRREGNRFLTADDHIVVPGAGYGITSKAGAAPSTGGAWIYATGMVRYWRTDPVVTPDNYADALGRDDNGIPDNTFTFRAGRTYLVDWDRCCHAAVQMDRCDDGCPT